ncbi:MAG TPA: tetratricopeptide repeat protein [Candidatus Rifleibacterium sp.]|nr:tetratricopeptide repeat protein [Candidatus Rifleibacterium sp.]HPT45490.1 tetratricopeptide repeat protein [Candidatus Rifleibacterium sp.]
MDAAVKLSDAGGFCCLGFDLPSAAWAEFTNDNISLLADDNAHGTIFSFSTGSELARGNISSEMFQSLNSAALAAFSRSADEAGAGFEDSCIFKSERFDVTGSFAAAVRSQANGDIAAAVKHYQAALAADPRLARAWNLLGVCLRIQGDIAGAEAAYRQAMQIVPGAPEAFCNLAILFEKSGRIEEAQQLFCNALENDQFYFNALLHRAAWLLDAGQIKNNEFSELNVRLLMHYSEIGAVQRHLVKAAERCDQAIEEFCETLHNENGGLANSRIQKLQRLIETQVLNGAASLAAGNMQLLCGMTPQTQAEKAVDAWCRQRARRLIDRLGTRVEQFGFFKILQPFLTVQVCEKPDEHKKAPLNIAEFFSLVLLEVMRDGQIEPPERDLLQRLRVALNVSEDAYITMFNNVRRQLAGIEVSGGLREKFSHQRLFKNLCQAAFRDGVVEDSEKKILGFACKAFNISPEEFKRMIAEVSR